MKSICHYCLFFYRPSSFSFFCGMLPSPTFCIPSQFVSWSAQPLEPPSVILVNVLASDAPTFLYLFNEVFYDKKSVISTSIARTPLIISDIKADRYSPEQQYLSAYLPVHLPVISMAAYASRRTTR